MSILFVHALEKNRDEVLGDLPAVVLFVTRHPDDLLADDVAEEHGAERENGVTRLHFAKSAFAYSPGDVIESRLFHAKLPLGGNLRGFVTVESAVQDQPGDRRILFEARQQAERERFEEASIVALRCVLLHLAERGVTIACDLQVKGRAVEFAFVREVTEEHGFVDAGVCGELFGCGPLESLLREKFLRSVENVLPPDLRDISDFSFCRHDECLYDAPNSECSLTLSANTILRRLLCVERQFT
jgi:hypothetical protein